MGLEKLGGIGFEAKSATAGGKRSGLSTEQHGIGVKLAKAFAGIEMALRKRVHCLEKGLVLEGHREDLGTVGVVRSIKCDERAADGLIVVIDEISERARDIDEVRRSY